MINQENNAEAEYWADKDHDSELWASERKDMDNEGEQNRPEES